MNAGLLRAWDYFDIGWGSGAFAASWDGTTIAKAHAQVASFWNPDGTGLVPGIELTLTATLSGSPSTTLTLSVPTQPISDTYSVADFETSLTTWVRITGFRMYVTGSGMKITWSALDWYVNGSIHKSYGSGSHSNAAISPAAAPWIGAGVQLQASAEAGTVVWPPAFGIIDSPPTLGTFGATCRSSIEGGWRYQEVGGGVWVAPPVTISALDPGSGGCTPAFDPPTGGDSWSVLARGYTVNQVVNIEGGEVTIYCCPQGQIIERPGIWQEYFSSTDFQLLSQSVWAIANVDRTVHRGNADYAALIYRAGLPSATRNGTWSSAPVSGSPIGGSNSDQPFPAAAAILSTIGASTHPLEYPLRLPLIAPYEVAQSNYQGEGALWLETQSPICVVEVGYEGGGNCSQTPDIEPPTGCYGSLESQFLGADGNGSLAYLDVSDPISAYANYLASPLWSCYFFRPGASDTGPDAWPVNGAAASPDDYWLKCRQQYDHNSALPPGEEHKTRIDMLSAPMLDSKLLAAWTSAFGVQTSPWGVSRFIAEIASTPSSATLTAAESALWSLSSCTAAFGGSITLTPSPSATSCSASVALGQFATDPRQVLELATKIAAGWSGSGISATSVKLVGIDGSTVEIGTAPGTYPWPSMRPASKYAGSWAQDYSVGYAPISGLDAGVDYDTGGISATEMGSAQTQYAFELLPGWTAASLVFDFTLSSDVAITLDYPVFTLPALAVGSSPRAHAVWESAFVQDVIYDSGAGVRFGCWDFWTGSAWQDPPGVRLFGAKSSALDWIGFSNCVMSGIASETNSTTRLSAWFDSVEGQTEALAATGTISWLHQPKAATPAIIGVVCNTFRELPPMACTPQPARDVSLGLTGAPSNEAWDWSSETRYYPTPGSVFVDMFDTGSPPQRWTAPSGLAIPGWSISSQRHVTDGTELATFSLQVAGKKMGAVDPWHGYLTVVGQASGGAIAYDVSRSKRHARLTTDGSDLWLGFAGNDAPTSFADSDTGIAGTYGRIRFQDYGPSGSLGLLHVVAGVLTYVQTDDEGRTFDTPMTLPGTLATGGFFDFDWGADGNRQFYWLEGSGPYTVYYCSVDTQGNITYPRTATNITDADLAPIAVRISYAAGGQWRVGLQYSSGGAVQSVVAVDAITFS